MIKCFLTTYATAANIVVDITGISHSEGLKRLKYTKYENRSESYKDKQSVVCYIVRKEER